MLSLGVPRVIRLAVGQVCHVGHFETPKTSEKKFRFAVQRGTMGVKCMPKSGTKWDNVRH
jgi:hypothetical protein